MKPFFKKHLVLILVLVLVSCSIGGTYAYLRTTNSPLLNTFRLARVDTAITEDTQDDTADLTANKSAVIVNQSISPVFVRARILVSGADAGAVNIRYCTTPSQYDTTGNTINILYNNAYWRMVGNGDDAYFYYQDILPGKTDGQTHSTQPLMQSVVVSSAVATDASFSVDVYEESVLTADLTYTQANAEAAFTAS